MKDTLILEQKFFPIKGPWGGVFKGEEEECCEEQQPLRVFGDMLGNVTRTTGRIVSG